MRHYSLILWLSILFCTVAANAQSNDPAQTNDSTIKLNAYDTRWVQVGAACIKALIANAKLKRKNTWNERFPDLETLCRDYEKYWFCANLYADKLGIARKEDNNEWLEHSLNLDISWRKNSILETGRESLKKFRRDIQEFGGAGADLLVDRSLMRFAPGETYTLSHSSEELNGFSKYPTPGFRIQFMGDFWPPNQRYWGDFGPASRGH